MSLPYMKFYVSDFEAATQHLDDAERGRYMAVLFALWRAPMQRLPNDDGWLARRFRRSVDAVKSELRPLIVEFCQCDGNWITQAKLSRVYKHAERQHHAQSVRAKARWQKEKSDAHAYAAPAMPTITRTRTISMKRKTIPSVSSKESAPGGAPTATQAALALNDQPSKPNGARHGARLPTGWRPTADLVTYAQGHGLDAAAEAAAFVDYWHAESGQRASKRDWQAAFRTWCRRSATARGRSPSSPVRPAAGGGGLDAFARGVARVVNARRGR